MDYLDKEKFVECFGYYGFHATGLVEIFDFEGEQDYQAHLRIRTDFHALISKGFTEYEAIIELCKQSNISFEILLKLDHEITITTFMNGKEWKASTFNGNRFDASEILADELGMLLYVRYKNIIFIEDASK